MQQFRDLFEKDPKRVMLTGWCIGASFWSVSMLIHQWNSVPQTVAMDLMLATLIYFAFRAAAADRPKTTYDIVYVGWFALFGFVFLVCDVVHVPEAIRIVLYCTFIVAIVIARLVWGPIRR